MGQTVCQTMPFNAHYAFVPAGKNSRYGQQTRASPAKTATYPITIGVWSASEAITGYFRPRLCENACAVLKSALLRKSVSVWWLSRPEICIGARFSFQILTVKPAPKRFHTAWTQIRVATGKNRSVANGGDKKKSVNG